MSLAHRPIHALPDHLINQIAAGEVVERPASIVKELLENSLDAGASTIRVEIRGGGADSLSVADDGHGIPRDELTLALTRHCTSKIRRAEDLAAIVSLGFRGEALASIAAVAEVNLASRVADASHAWVVQAQPGKAMPLPEPGSRSQGTTVTVRNLFATLPARRQFMRRATTESLVIQQLLRGLAFCVPAVGLSLGFEERRQWQAVAAKDERSAAQRWRAVFGAEFAREARFIERIAGDLRLYGWVGPPELARAQADLQFLAVNGRLVRDRQLVHGIRMAFEDRLPPGRYASFALHLELPPTEVDVNVHPSKTEVRFRHLREVHDLFFSTTREALAAGPIAARAAKPAATAARDGGAASFWSGTSSPPVVRDAVAPWEPRLDRVAHAETSAPTERSGAGLIGERYLAVPGQNGGLRLVDLVALMTQALALQSPATPRVLAFPVRVPAPPGPTASLALAELLRFQLEFSAIGPGAWVLRTLPGWLPALDAERLVASLLRDDDFLGDPPGALARALANALELPSGWDARAAWLDAWVQPLAGLVPGSFECVPTAEDLAALFARQRRER